MARLPRLVVPGQAHLVLQRGHNGQPVFADDLDRETFLAVLEQLSSGNSIQTLAWALPDSEILLLLIPETDTALSRFMQSLGRRYVSAYNRRHGCSGTLWDGRFRCAVIEAGANLGTALAWIDSLAAAGAWTTAPQRLGGKRDALLVDPPEYWRLGNTPFEREAAYRRLLDEVAPQPVAERLRAAVLGGWAFGSDRFVQQLTQSTPRPLRPRSPGRPRRSRD